jgi:site-specific recombinase XerD
MLKHKESYLGYKMTYTQVAYSRYGDWLNMFEKVIEKEEGDVTIDDILQFKLWLQASYAEKSVQFAMSIIRNYFNFLKMSNVPCINPQLIRLPKARANSYPAASLDDYQKILQSIDEFMLQNEFNYLQMHLIIRILGETGVRVSELTSIVIDNINLEKCGAIIDNKKNVNKRWIYWSSSTNELLKRYLPLKEYLNLESGTLFINVKKKITSRVLTRRNVREIIAMCCKKAGIDHIVPHSFRHGKAHNILENGGNVADVQKTLGHLSPLSSMKYLQYSDKEHERRSKMFLVEEKAGQVCL